MMGCHYQGFDRANPEKLQRECFMLVDLISEAGS